MSVTESRSSKLRTPKEMASEWLLAQAEVEVGSWSGLDESGPDKVGVGLFFRISPDDGSLRVVSIVPGSSAHKSGLVRVKDMLVRLDDESVQGWSLHQLRLRLHGPPGSFVTLDMTRDGGGQEPFSFKLDLMRGSPYFIQFQDRYGTANAAQLNALILQKREEQKFLMIIEKQLKLEQARLVEVRRSLGRRRDVLSRPSGSGEEEESGAGGAGAAEEV
eukprot:764891-Hanusia_phi.AAC.4